MRKYHKITPEGTKDLLFEECLTHRYVERTLADVFSSHGFHEVITPGVLRNRAGSYVQNE